MRKIALPAVIIITSVIFIMRIFYLQVIDDSLKLKSENLLTLISQINS